MLDQLKQRTQAEQGFTTIEVLVVMMVVAILMTIAVPVFLDQRQKAHVSLVKSDVRNTVLANGMRLSSEGSGVPPGSYTEGQNVGDTDNVFPVSKGVTVTVNPTEIQGTHAGLGGDTWTYDKASGTYSGTGAFN